MDANLEAVLQRIFDLKQSIAALIMKIETEYQTINWTTIQDNYALISGQITLLTRFLKNEKMPSFRNYALVPFALSPEEDPNLRQLTEGRISFFNHEVAPRYLRTKPEPEVDDRIMQMQNKAHSLSQDNTQKQLNTMNKLANSIQDSLKSSRDSLDSDPVQKGMIMQVSTMNDTLNLVAAIVNGKGLKTIQPASQSQHIPEQRINIPQNPPNAMPGLNMGKITGSIKTNIKSGAGQAPYNR